MRYAIALRREFRKSDSVPQDWPDKVSAMEGVTRIGDVLYGRMTVKASEAAIERLQAAFGTFLHIEPVILHDPREPHEPGP